MEVTREEQYSAIRFCFRLKDTSYETYAKLHQACGEDAVPRATVFRWFKDFKEGRVLCVKECGHGVTASAVTGVNINTAIHRAGWRLQHDNARPHVANHVMQFLAKFNITYVLHPTYSSDLAPCDFFLFPSLKAKLRGIRFEIYEAVLKKSEAILKDLRHVFEEWQQRCKKCIQLGRSRPTLKKNM